MNPIAAGVAVLWPKPSTSPCIRISNCRKSNQSREGITPAGCPWPSSNQTACLKTTSSSSRIFLVCRPISRSEEHTSELQSRPHLVCRLLLEKKKKKQHTHTMLPKNLQQPIHSPKKPTIAQVILKNKSQTT